MQKAVRDALLGWYFLNKRNMPWRNMHDPYPIWLSEVIMQQTRVEQGTPYFLKFISQYPEVTRLAAAPEQEVMKLWQGLGYYSRARNLHHAAKTIAEKYNGRFPETYEEIIKLKGIGEYTAAAIVSIAYGHPYAVLDGNVYRVLSRLYAEGLPINHSRAKTHYTALATGLLDKKSPGDFNQAIMELGALVCKPKNPVCDDCPLTKCCLAFKTKRQEDLPLRLPKKAVKKRFLHYLIVREADGMFFRKRQAGDIWQGLFDFPLVEKLNEENFLAHEAEDALGTAVKGLHFLHSMKHQLTHQELHISFYKIDTVEKMAASHNGFIFVADSELEAFPHPKPIEFFLKEFPKKLNFW